MYNPSYVQKVTKEIGGRVCVFGSLFETRWATYLEILKRGGEIKEWDYEPKKFPFYGDDIKHTGLKGKELGVRVYTPDFKITENDGSHRWEETKGHLDGKSYTKLRCFRLYYPDEAITLVMQRLPSFTTSKGRAKWVKLKRLETMGVTIRSGEAIVKQMKRRM